MYNVVVTDSFGCTFNGSVTVSEPPQLNAGLVSTTDVLCFGGLDGTAIISASGGILPYTYDSGTSTLVTNNTTDTLTGLAFGGYTTTITDANGCLSTISFLINQSSLLTVNANITSAYNGGAQISCNGACDGAATAVGAGGQSFPPPGISINSFGVMVKPHLPQTVYVKVNIKSL